jgi:ABC-2 type transport system ATP-binding protein
MPETPLRTEQFGRRYRRNRPWAVRNLSLAVPEGSITALVGPNGSGKSTLIRACLGFEEPDEGRVLIFGTDPQRQRAEAVYAIGYIPQSRSLYRSLSIGDHLTMAVAARRSFDRAHAAARIADAGLGEKRWVGELSGGEQAQVALALALGTRAPLLLLDEPLASLDPLARRDFVTDVEQICDRLVVLAEGRLALDSTVADAKQVYRTLSAAELDGQPIIGSFAGSSGEPLALVRGGHAGSPATLEEIVLGHLAAARTRRAEAA